MIDVIKEYLVKIGASIDTASFLRVNKIINTFSKQFTLSFSLATIAITTAIAALLDKVAQADLETKKLAISLYTTVENARSLKTVMDTMGVKDLNDLKYVNLIPEQRKQFLALRQLSRSLEPGNDTKESLKGIREVGYEVQKLQVIFSYFWIYVAGALAKILQGPIKQLTKMLTEWVKGSQKNFQVWSNYLAGFLAIFVRIFDVAVKIVEIAGKLLQLIPFFDRIPALLKLIIDVSLFLLNKFDKFLDRIENLDITKGAKEWGKAIESVTKDPQKVIGKAVVKHVQNSIQSSMEDQRSFILRRSGKAPVLQVPGEKNNTQSTVKTISSSLDYLKEIARRENLRITSTTGGRHNKGSKHALGQAIDFDHRGVNDSVIMRLRETYGLKVLDERSRPKGQAVWGGPHFHAQIAPQRAMEYAEKLKMTAAQPTKSPTINIHVNGAQHPKQVAEAVSNKLRDTLTARNMRGIYI